MKIEWGGNFLNSWAKIQEQVHQTAVEHGWWEDGVQDHTGAVMIALMHAELSEALEAMRKDLQSDHIEEYHGVEEELADVVIRIMDYAEVADWRVGEAILAKMAFNEGREYKHGGKRF